jgi:hypothetical protein
MIVQKEILHQDSYAMRCGFLSGTLPEAYFNNVPRTRYNASYRSIFMLIVDVIKLLATEYGDWQPTTIRGVREGRINAARLLFDRKMIFCLIRVV